MSSRFAASPGDPFRWGVYLRPDAATAAAVTTLTGLLRAQYGLLSAGAFPPHVTLVGSIHTEAPGPTLVAAVEEALRGTAAVPVHNAGIAPMGVGFVYDVDRLPDGSRNSALGNLADAVESAVGPLATPAPAPDRSRDGPPEFQAHLSLASHDLLQWEHLHDEVGEFLQDAPVTAPSSFLGRTVVLCRTESDDWTGRWWRTLRHQHVHSIQLEER